MSKQRAVARAQRQAVAAERARAAADARQRTERARASRARRRLMWRRIRLWQHGPGFRREVWGAMGTVVLLLVVVAYLVTGSVTAVVLTGLVLVVVSPALIKLFFERK
ncbi:MAG TPA: hypothetical protein VGN35_06480 [Jatrophihabitantaceae bacterium]|jgi:hypothetical protein|nr:hypothetical protein [Jatrophihabitantaceae bacterium]